MSSLILSIFVVLSFQFIALPTLSAPLSHDAFEASPTPGVPPQTEKRVFGLYPNPNLPYNGGQTKIPVVAKPKHAPRAPTPVIVDRPMEERNKPKVIPYYPVWHKHPNKFNPRSTGDKRDLVLPYYPMWRDGPKSPLYHYCSSSDTGEPQSTGTAPSPTSTSCFLDPFNPGPVVLNPTDEPHSDIWSHGVTDSLPSPTPPPTSPT